MILVITTSDEISSGMFQNYEFFYNIEIFSEISYTMTNPLTERQQQNENEEKAQVIEPC